MTFLIDGVISTASAGSFVFIPRGIPHTFWHESAVPAKQVTAFTPAGIDAYFEEVTRVMTDGGDGTLEAATALMETHDTVIPQSTRHAYGALTTSETHTEWCQPRIACLLQSAVRVVVATPLMPAGSPMVQRVALPLWSSPRTPVRERRPVRAKYLRCNGTHAPLRRGCTD